MGTCCHSDKKKVDLLFNCSLIAILISYTLHLLNLDFNIPAIKTFTGSTFEIINKMWIGVAVGIIFVGIIDLVPKDVVNKLIGHEKGVKGIFRAAIAGVVFDLCSHGILLVAMKLYKKGVSLPQVIAFLVASPWNSISLTIILFTLIGLKWTVIFTLLSIAVAVLSGVIFQFLVNKNILPKNPNTNIIDNGFSYKEAFRKKYEGINLNFNFFATLIKQSFIESKMIIRWLFLGVIIASSIRAFMPEEMFMGFFGASIAGIFITLIATTILEVCSEGSVPIAADILTRAMAPGNAFVFLMAGVSTDYTEILALRETTQSWKVALFLPVVTVPQIVVLGYILNFI